MGTRTPLHSGFKLHHYAYHLFRTQDGSGLFSGLLPCELHKPEFLPERQLPACSLDSYDILNIYLVFDAHPPSSAFKRFPNHDQGLEQKHKESLFLDTCILHSSDKDARTLFAETGLIQFHPLP